MKYMRAALSLYLLAGISRIFIKKHGGASHNYNSHSKVIEDKPRWLKVNLGSLFTFFISIGSLCEIYAWSSKTLFISRNQPFSYYFDYVILRNFTKIPREKESKDLVGAPKKFFSRVRNEVEGTGYLQK